MVKPSLVTLGKIFSSAIGICMLQVTKKEETQKDIYMLAAIKM